MVDWKTGGRSSDGHSQLAVYGLFAQRVWGLGAAKMVAHLAYLDGASVDRFELDSAALAAAEAQILASVQLMRRLEASQAAGQSPDPAAFALTDDRSICQRCNFRRICERG